MKLTIKSLLLPVTAVLAIVSFTSASLAGGATQVVLDSTSVRSSDLEYFETLFAGHKDASYADLHERIQSFSADFSLGLVQDLYRDQFFKFLGMDLMAWMELNSTTYLAINAYVDDPADGGQPLWQTTNQKLRSQKPLSLIESEFKVNLENAMDVLPAYSCICFRGAALSKKMLKTYQEGSVVHKPAFTSTSIDPNVAIKFANTNDEKRISTIYIIKTKSGTPVSSFHAFHWSEYEVLIRSGQTFMVHRVALDATERNAIIVLEQL